MGRPTPPIPHDFLTKRGGQWKRLSLIHLAVMLHHVWKAENDPEVGWEDPQRTAKDMSRALNRKVFVDPAIIESAMWACNILNEQGKFEHPMGFTFDEWVGRIIDRRGRFDRDYNLIEWGVDKAPLNWDGTKKEPK